MEIRGENFRYNTTHHGVDSSVILIPQLFKIHLNAIVRIFSIIQLKAKKAISATMLTSLEFQRLHVVKRLFLYQNLRPVQQLSDLQCCPTETNCRQKYSKLQAYTIRPV